VAENKNQHYVPRMYLRNFSSTDSKKTIHLYNLPSKKARSNAPLKSQCSAPYFYGKDSVVDKALQELEGEVTGIIHDIIRTNAVPKPRSIEFGKLLTFTLFLHCRTKHAANVQNDIAEKFIKSILEKEGVIDKEQINAVKIGLTDPAGTALRSAAQGVLLALDLKMKVLINLTNVEFITSDNPVVFYNQCFEGANPIIGSNTGLACKGLQIFLPLSPLHLLILYDSKVYKVGEKKSDSCKVTNPEDALQFNDLQYQNCLENLYAYGNFASADIFVLEQRNRMRTRIGMSILNEYDQGQRPDGNRSVLMHMIKPDHRIKLSVQPIRQLAKLSEGELNASPKPFRKPDLFRIFKEFWGAVKANKYAPNEMIRFAEDKMKALPSGGSVKGN
jgi:hypothetical protein